MALSTANDAMRAIAMQLRRIECASEPDDTFFASTGFRQEVDVYFLLLALRWLHESCKLTLNLTSDSALQCAIEEFERRLPHARNMRDVREHVSDYIGGQGRLQSQKTMQDRRGHEATLGIRMWFGQDRKSTFVWAGMEIHLDEAKSSAEHLYSSLCRAIAPHGLAIEQVPLRAQQP